MEHFEQLQQLQLHDVPLTPHSVDSTNVFRDDEHGAAPEGLSREDALGQAPEARSGLFLVPSIME